MGWLSASWYCSFELRSARERRRFVVQPFLDSFETVQHCYDGEVATEFYRYFLLLLGDDYDTPEEEDSVSAQRLSAQRLRPHGGASVFGVFGPAFLLPSADSVSAEGECSAQGAGHSFETTQGEQEEQALPPTASWLKYCC